MTTDHAPAPATDRPLTVGDVHLLREGDVLRVDQAGSFLLGLGLVDGGEAIVRSIDPPYVDVHGPKERGHNRPSRFTFVRRPAASDEGVRAVSKAASIRAVDACGGTYSVDEERSGYADGHREALTAALSSLASMPVVSTENQSASAWSLVFSEQYGVNAETTFKTKDKAVEYASRCGEPKPRIQPLYALASPPVSERERALEGALRRLVDNHGAYIEALPGTSGVSDLETARSLLTAQPAGEGK
jgi:hypothetical protein